MTIPRMPAGFGVDPADGPAPVPPAIPAATVVVIRDDQGDGHGLEVLMLRRNATVSFGGMWVFPGGRVEESDGEAYDAYRNAAVREAHEEAGLRLEPADLVPLSWWIPPAIAPKRFDTAFFIAAVPDLADVAVDMGEIHEHVWTTPEAAFARHAAAEIEMAPPTWVTLQWLSRHENVAAALAAAGAREPWRYATRLYRSAETGRAASVWEGDAAYDHGDLDEPGPRHRLWMRKSGAWEYDNDTGI